MNVASNWNPIIEKFHKRLTSWKAKTLSYGGRLTLLKSVLGALEKWVMVLHFPFGKTLGWGTIRDLRDGHEKDQLDGLLYLLRDFDPSDVEDSWACSLNSNNTYTVSSMRKMIEGNLLPFQEEKIRWNRYLPIKMLRETQKMLQSCKVHLTHAAVQSCGGVGGINQEPDRNNTASRADDNRIHQDIQSE
ncbi:hypothetical protein Tco_0657080 [Tanacetum coccineum]|uniref:Uncharacterized protein n=1 Tax=Tanacetum coccineum TaxID=301880 RepID=A0ABQ4XBX1_9ASTR